MNKWKRLYPILFYTFWMPVIAGMMTGFPMIKTLLQGTNDMIEKLAMCLVWMAWAIGTSYVFGGFTSFVAGLSVSLAVGRNIHRWQIMLISIMAAVIASLVVVYFVMKKPSLMQLMIFWSIVGPVLTGLAYFRSRNFQYFHDKGK